MCEGHVENTLLSMSTANEAKQSYNQVTVFEAPPYLALY